MQSFIITAQRNHKILDKTGTLVDFDETVKVKDIAVFESLDALHDAIFRLSKAGRLTTPVESQLLSAHF
jgi:hypothetical protein